jgi:spore maturation protein CgeB
MAAMGFCPSGRMFEATACGTPVLSDYWEGIERFFAPGEEILLADSADAVTAALDLSDARLARMARAARERTLEEHSSARRADELIALIEDAASPTVSADVMSTVTRDASLATLVASSGRL